MPFEIEPMGDLSKRLHKDEALRRWAFLAERMGPGGYSSVSAAMNFTGATVFSPLKITDRDWQAIVEDLGAEDKNK